MADNIANQDPENVSPRPLTAKEVEENMKELLIYLVKARQFIYDKSHPCITRQMPRQKPGMRFQRF